MAKERQFMKFSDVNKDFSIQSWLSLFETHTSKESDPERVISLMYSLEGKAFGWYGQEVAGKSLDWKTTKEKMTKRFGLSTATPLLDAQRRYLKREEKVEDYFLAKINLLRLTTLTEAEMVQQLTEGVPITWRLTLTSSRVSDPNEWIALAQQIENHYTALNKRNNFTFKPKTPQRNQRQQTFIADNSNSTSNQQLPPCRYCQNLGRQEYHWHRDCPNREQQFQQWQQPFSRQQQQSNFQRGRSFFRGNYGRQNHINQQQTSTSSTNPFTNTAEEFQPTPDQFDSIHETDETFHLN